jgi:uncharacterized membrane protein
MNKSHKDLLVVFILDIMGLASIWVPIPGEYPFYLFSYILIIILPGYPLIRLLKSELDLRSRLEIGFLFSMALIMGILFVLASFGLYYYYNYLPTILLVFSILLSFVTYLHDIILKKNKKGQITLEEAFERILQMQTKTEKTKTIKAPHSENTFKETDNESISKTATIQGDVKPLQNEFIQNGHEEDVKPADRISHPLWREQSKHEEGFRYWDLFVVTLLTALTLVFLNLNLFIKPEYTSLIAYLSMLLLFSYALLVVFYPLPNRMGMVTRLMSSIIIAILIFVVTFFLFALEILIFVPLPFFYMIAVLNVLIIFVALFRRKYAYKDVEKKEELSVKDIPNEILFESEMEPLKAHESVPQTLLNTEPVIIVEHEDKPEDIEFDLPLLDDDVDVIIPNHVSKFTETSLRSDNPKKRSDFETITKPLETGDIEVLKSEKITKSNLHTQKKKSVVFPWIERHKKRKQDEKNTNNG